MKCIIIVYSFFLSIFSLKMKPNLCINCKFFIKNSILFNDAQFGKCSFFQIEEDNVNHLVTGSAKIKNTVNYYYCSTARACSNMCGKEGVYYTSKKYKK
jgi:hypothetical protein